MIKFVNAKINIGLNVVRKREDGYHDIETVFFPIGIESGTPQQPEPFDDILEVVSRPAEMPGCRFQFIGRKINCKPEDNIIIKSVREIINFCLKNQKFNTLEDFGGLGVLEITLDKHLPDGAGLGGGSADASFTLMAINEIAGNVLSKNELLEIALKIGADCPFFIYNTPCYAEGKGEKLFPITLDLKGYFLLIVKPDIFVSTKEAFSGIIPKPPVFNLRNLSELPVSKWREYVFNDFETSIFPLYPALETLKQTFYDYGSIYSSMSGSGASIYGIFQDKDTAIKARDLFEANYSDVWLFGL